jgi:hypothetical protein
MVLQTRMMRMRMYRGMEMGLVGMAGVTRIGMYRVVYGTREVLSARVTLRQC